jgi:ABC-2 type transport system ATP-binding protein
MSAVIAEDLTKTYYDWRRRRTEALRGVSVRVEPGTIVGLLGRNGAGKTTLVKILLGLVIPDGGRGRLLGHSLRDHRVRRRIGYLPEQMRLPEYLKGPAFLRYMGNLNGVPSATLKNRIPGLLERMGLGGEVTRQLIRGYSKGMQQRLGLAQALLNDPELLFLDEPTEGLDPVGRKDTRDLLVDLRRQGKTIFLNSHLLSEIELVCDHLIMVEKGLVVRQGTPADFMQSKGVCLLRVASLTPAARTLIESLAPGAAWQENTLRFAPRDRAHLNAVIDALRAAGVEIESVEPQRSTLEETFLEVVGGGAA